jgi:sugar lactone lactonase YvrE
MKVTAFLRFRILHPLLLSFRRWKMGISAGLCCLFVALVVGFCPAALGQGSVQYIGNVSTVASGLSENLSGPASGVAVDGSGNVYIAEVDNNRVLKETLSAGSYIQTVVANGTNGLNYPSGVAVDGSGNVYIANFTSGDVYKETPTTGGYSQTLVANSAINGLQTPQGVAVDGSGNVYIADTGNNRVLKETLSSGGYTQSVVASSPDSPYAVAVDGSGNVYIADYTSGTVVKETPTLGGYSQSVIADPANNGWLYVSGVAVDGSGNVYIAAAPNQYVYKETLSGGTYTQSLLPTGIEAYTGAAAPCCGANALGVAVDGSGNLYTNGLGVVYKETASAVNFGAVDVGSTSGIVYMYFAFTAEDPASSIVVSNQSSTGLDFAPSGNPNNTCDTPSYNGWFCYVPVKFMPQLLGLRSGVVTVTDSSTPPVVVTAQITGTGVAPQASFLPENQVAIASHASPFGLLNPEGVAVDGSGNVYIADTGNGRVLKETLSAGSYTQTVIPYKGAINASGPAGVAVNTSGNVYIADPNNGIYKETLASGAYTQTLISSALASEVAVDSSGNIYFAVGPNVYKETLNAGSYMLSTIGTDALLDSLGVAVDGGGNIYVTDVGSSHRVVKWTHSGTSYIESTIVSGLGYPWGVAVDGNGNVYVGDQAGHAYKLTPSGSSYSQSTITTSNVVPYGIAVDGSGNVYIADSINNKVNEIGPAVAPTLSFASTAVGSTSSDSPQIVTVQNSGTGTLIFPTPTSGNNPSITSNFSLGSLTTCPVLSASSSPGTLAAGASCVYSVSFSPTTTGPISGSLVLTDNSLNATNPYAVQSITLNGTATGQAQVPVATLSATSLTFASQTDGTTSSAQTLTLTNSGTAALAITSITTSGDFAQTDTCGMSVAVGAKCTISVTFTPTVAGTRTGTLTIADNASGSPQPVVLSGTGSASVVTAPAVMLLPTSLTYAPQMDGTTSAAQTVTLTNSGTAALAITSIAASGDFALTQSCGTSVTAGASCTLSVTFTPTAAGTRTGTVTITDNANGSPQTVALSGGGEAVSLSTVSTGITIPSAGGSGTAAIQLSSVNGFTGTVNLTCAVTYLGQGTPTSPPTCSLSPAQAQVTGSSPVSSTLTIATTSASASLVHEHEMNGAKLVLAAMFFFGLLPRRRYRKGFFPALCLAAFCLGAGVGVIGCGGSSGGSNTQTVHGTTTGNYQVVVTAASGTVTASTTIPISVQ